MSGLNAMPVTVFVHLRHEHRAHGRTRAISSFNSRFNSPTLVTSMRVIFCADLVSVLPVCVICAIMVSW